MEMMNENGFIYEKAPWNDFFIAELCNLAAMNKKKERKSKTEREREKSRF